MRVDEVFSFPLELEREIFETAALQDVRTIPTLLRVCRRVFVWVEPLLYRVVIIPSNTAPILHPVRSKPSTFLQMAVRHLFIGPSKKDIIRSCSNTVSLFIDGRLNTNLLDVLDQTHLQRLHFTLPRSLAGWASATLTRPAFLSLTHLELYQDDEDDDLEDVTWSQFSPIASLPSLTHLCLSEFISSPILSDLVAECPQLVVIVTVWWEGAFSVDAARSFAASRTLTDPRVVLMVVGSYIEDWKLGARGGADFWVRAETFVAMKRKGDIPKTTFLLDHGVQIGPSGLVVV
ncbi:hypothetical protein C8R46DRAFT_470254 [Mycena filopes]|nr:hypothetical protein C8R46DRAFT_470254 [Mycena filopes]